MTSDQTVVYLDGGKEYAGRERNHSIGYWKAYGKELGYDWLYTGRHNGMQVVVFTKQPLSFSDAQAKRKSGMTSIAEFYIGNRVLA